MLKKKTETSKKTAATAKTSKTEKKNKTVKKAPAAKTVKGTAESKPRKPAARKVMTDLGMVECIAEAMSEKKGANILSMDLREIPGASFDFFVVCDATSGPQVRAIADEIEEQVYRNFKQDPIHKEGYNNAEWVLLDFGGVLAHIFLDSVRQHYKLEELWGDSGMKHFNGDRN